MFQLTKQDVINEGARLLKVAPERIKCEYRTAFVRAERGLYCRDNQLFYVFGVRPCYSSYYDGGFTEDPLFLLLYPAGSYSPSYNLTVECPRSGVSFGAFCSALLNRMQSIADFSGPVSDDEQPAVYVEYWDITIV